jgi:hypothetical protein
MRGDKGRVRKQRLPGAPEFDQVIAVGPIPVQKNHESACRARARLEARPLELSRHCLLRSLERESHRAF